MILDLVYEILKFLHLSPEENGGALLARKVLISQNSYRKLESRTFEKPIVFRIFANVVDLTTNKDGHIYSVDNKVGYNLQNSISVYLDDPVFHIIKIFGHLDCFTMPYNTIEVYSIGSLTKTSHMFSNNRVMSSIILKKLDTSNVTDMSHMFYECYKVNQNIGQNWNVSNVTNMSGMFSACRTLNKNIGKNWDTSNVVDMSNMFECCFNLNKPIGKNWNLDRIENMRCMFIHCQCLPRNVSQILNISPETDKTDMFHGCEVYC